MSICTDQLSMLKCLTAKSLTVSACMTSVYLIHALCVACSCIAVQRRYGCSVCESALSLVPLWVLVCLLQSSLLMEKTHPKRKVLDCFGYNVRQYCVCGKGLVLEAPDTVRVLSDHSPTLCWLHLSWGDESVVWLFTHSLLIAFVLRRPCVVDRKFRSKNLQTNSINCNFTITNEKLCSWEA